MAGEILLLEYADVESDSFIKGDGRIYAMIFDPITNEAIDFSSSTPYELDYFDGDQSRFARVIPQTPNRNRHYSEVLQCTAITLPDVGYGNYYTIEYWSEYISGSIDRSVDYFLGTDRLTWLSNRRAESRLDLSQAENIASLAAVEVWDYLRSLATTTGSMGEYLANLQDDFASYFMSHVLYSESSPEFTGTFEELILDLRERIERLPDEPASVRYEALCSVAYDTEIERITFEAWLEKDGVLQIDTLRAEVTLYNSAGTGIAAANSTTPNAMGQFTIAVDGVPLSPDEVYFLVSKVRDSDSVDHSSGSSPVTWD